MRTNALASDRVIICIPCSVSNNPIVLFPRFLDFHLVWLFRRRPDKELFHISLSVQVFLLRMSLREIELLTRKDIRRKKEFPSSATSNESKGVCLSIQPDTLKR